jgi:predicted enzyme related to lactoylglutathione lyase
MSRVQLSINVSDFDAAVAFYSRLFGAAPAKLRPGYANFAIEDPPLQAGAELARQRPRRHHQPPRR